MRKLLNLLRGRRARLENDLDRELRYHFDLRVEDLRAEGRSQDDARKQAAIEMGGIEQVQEDVRETWTLRWLEDAARDARYAARSLARSPGFTITAVASLAIGIGASAAIFSLLDQVLLRLLPVREPQRLVLVDWKGNALAHARGSGAGFNLMSYPICRDLQEQARFFDGVLCRHPTEVYLAVAAGQTPELVGTEIVSGSYFPVLGVSPALGRLLNEDDDRQPGAHPVVVLSYAYWLKAFGGAPDVVGRRVLVNNFPMTVVGVASATFRGIDIGDVPAVWIPAAMKKQATPEWDKLLDRRTRWMQVIGRLRPGVTGEQAQAGLQPWFKSMLDEDTRREGFPLVTAKLRAEFLASTLVVTPAAHGHSLLRQDLGRRSGCDSGDAAAAPARVAQRGQPVPGPRGRAAQTSGHAWPWARRVGGSRPCCWRTACGSPAAGALGLLVAPMVSRGLMSFLPSERGRYGPVVTGGRARVRVRVAHDDGHRRAVRGRARVAGRPRAPDFLASGIARERRAGACGCGRRWWWDRWPSRWCCSWARGCSCRRFCAWSGRDPASRRPGGWPSGSTRGAPAPPTRIPAVRAAACGPSCARCPRWRASGWRAWTC